MRVVGLSKRVRGNFSSCRVSAVFFREFGLRFSFFKCFFAASSPLSWYLLRLTWVSIGSWWWSTFGLVYRCCVRGVDFF